MDFVAIRERLDQECDFPVEHDRLVEVIGGVDLDGPAPESEAETVGAVLDRTDETTYRSADDVYATLVGTVGDGYIGRKYYDDRAGARSSPHGRSIESV